MAARNAKRWILVVLPVWALALAGVIAAGVYVHRRSPAILDRVVATDPAPQRRALRLRLEADRLVARALARHEATTSGALAARAATTGTLVSEAIPMLREAERLYLESLDAASSQPGVLFQLGEVNLLMGRRARGCLFMARHWESLGEPALARVYRRRAQSIDPAVSISMPTNGVTSGSAD